MGSIEGGWKGWEDESSFAIYARVLVPSNG